MPHIQIGAGVAGSFQLIIDSSCDNIAGGKALHFVVVLHKLHQFAPIIPYLENAAFSAQSLTDQEGFYFGGEKDRGMELVKFHICDFSKSPVSHSDPGTAGAIRIASVKINFSATAGGKGGTEAGKSLDLVIDCIKDISTEDPVLADITEAYRGNQVHSGIIFKNLDPGIGTTRLHQRALHLRTGNVPGMKDPAFFVSAFPSEVKFLLSGGICIAHFCPGGEVGTQFDKPFDPLRSFADDIQHGISAAEVGTGGESIFQMFFKGIVFIGNASDAALSHFAVAVIDRTFGNDSNGAFGFLCEHQGRGKTGEAAADDQMVEIKFFTCNHFLSVFSLQFNQYRCKLSVSSVFNIP